VTVVNILFYLWCFISLRIVAYKQEGNDGIASIGVILILLIGMALLNVMVL